MKDVRGVKESSRGEFWRELDPLLGRYFRERFQSPTDAQRKALQTLRQGKDLLVVSPTGTGKTFTAFLAVLDHLVSEAREGRLQNKTYCVYISPLKALGNDIRRNLEEPLEAVYELAKEEGVPLQEIRISIRTGDTLAKERLRQLRHPPHILITTPESLVLLLSSSHQKYLKNVNYVIADELQSLLPTKRGTMLAVALQWLDHINRPGRPIRIGLSATLSRPREALKFLLGYEGGRWKKGVIIDSKMSKRYSFEIRYTPSWSKLLDEVGEIINSHKVTMVFTGRRREAEEISYYLKAKGFTDLYPHHGSLSKEVREEVEALLKRGELKAVITSTSLELGIDVGDVDVVVQISPPPSPSALLQRVGRAGHGIGKTSKGIILARTRHEILESANLVDMARKGILERISIPEEPWDVAVQMATAMATGGLDDIREMHRILRNSYPFRRVRVSVLKKIIEDLANLSRYSVKLMDRFTLRDGGRKVQVRRGFKHLFYTNVGTIVPEIKYVVYTSSPLKRVGELSEDFVERLSRYDVFMLGGKSYQLLEIRGRRIIVREVEGLLAVAPRWTGEAPNRPPEVSDNLSHTLQYISEKIVRRMKKGGGRWNWVPLLKMLSRRYGLDEISSEELFYYVLSLINHRAIPLKQRAVYERVKGPTGSSFALYYPSTQATMRALSHMLRFIYRRDFGYLSRTTVADDGFVMSLPAGLPTPLEILAKKEDLDRWREEGIKLEEVYLLRLKNVLFRSLFLLKSYRGKPVGPRKIQNDFRLFLSLLNNGGLGTLGTLLQKEALKEVTSGPLDVDGALKLKEHLLNSEVEIVEAISPSPLLKELFEGGEYESTESDISRTHTVKEVGVKDIGEREVEVPDEILENLIKEFAESVLRGEPPAPIQVPLDGSERRKEMITNLSKRLKRAGRSLNAIRAPGGYVLLPPGLERIWVGNIERGKDEGRSDEEDLPGIVYPEEYTRKKVSKSESMEALRRAVLWYVRRIRPATLGLLKHLLPLKESLLDKAVEELEEEGEVLIVDLPGGERALLPPGSTPEAIGDVIPLEDLNRYRFFRTGEEFDSWEEYFEMFWGFRSPYEVLSRVRGMSLKRIIKSIIDEEVLPLSWGGTTVFTHRKKLLMFLALKEKIDLSVYQRRALRILSVKNISSHWELGKSMKIPARSAETLLSGLQEMGLAIKPDSLFRELTGLKGHIKPTLQYLTPSERAVLEGVERERVAKEALLQILSSLGPLTVNEISNYTGLNAGRTRELLDRLFRENRVEIGMVKGGGVIPVFGAMGWKEEFQSLRGSVKETIKAYTSDDSLMRAYFSTRSGGRDQVTVHVVKGGEVVALLHIVEESDRVHIKNFEIYDLKNVGEIVRSLQPLLEYLEESGHSMITLKKVLGLEGDEISPQIKELLVEHGFTLCGRTWIRGIPAETLNSDSIKYEISSILKRQRLIRAYHIRHPLELLLLWGNIRDDWEVLSRMGGVYYAEIPQKDALKKIEEAGRRLLNAARIIDDAPEDAVKLIFTEHKVAWYTGRTKAFYSMKEMARQYGLLRGYFFPGTLAWGTLQHALLYRSAVSMEMGKEEKSVLNLFKGGRNLTLAEIKSRSSLSQDRVKEVVESLLKGGVLYKDSYGRYLTLPDVDLPPKGSSMTLLLNELATLIPFRASKVKSYLGYPIRGYELREALKIAALHGPLKPHVDEKGLLWSAGRDSGFTMGEEEIVILSPRDRLFNYFREDIRALFGDDYLYPVFRGGRIVAAVKMRKKGRDLSDMRILGGRSVSMREVLAYLKEYRFRT